MVGHFSLSYLGGSNNSSVACRVPLIAKNAFLTSSYSDSSFSLFSFPIFCWNYTCIWRPDNTSPTLRLHSQRITLEQNSSSGSNITLLQDRTEIWSRNRQRQHCLSVKWAFALILWFGFYPLWLYYNIITYFYFHTWFRVERRTKNIAMLLWTSTLLNWLTPYFRIKTKVHSHSVSVRSFCSIPISAYS